MDLYVLALGSMVSAGAYFLGRWHGIQEYKRSLPRLALTGVLQMIVNAVEAAKQEAKS